MCRLRNRTSVKVRYGYAVVNSLIYVFAVVTHREHHGVCHQVVGNQCHRNRIDHFAHHKPRLVKRIRILQHLAFARTSVPRFRLFDVCNRARLVTPGVVNQDFRIHAEQLVQRFRILDAYAGNVAHRVDAAPCIQPTIFQTFCYAAAHLPKTRNRPVRPKLFAVTHLVKFRDAYAIIIRFHMLRHHVHGDFA